jgi:hypothetical protein
MSAHTSTRIAAGVTTAYLRDLTRRSAPATGPEARRATSRGRPAGARTEDGPGRRRRSAPSRGSCRRRELATVGALRPNLPPR